MSMAPGSSVVVIGAGVVGEALAARLREDDAAISLHLTARSAESVERLRARGFTASAFDVTTATPAQLTELLGGATHVVYSAAAGRGGDYEAVYAHGTAQLATHCTSTGTHFVYTSSTGVYAARAGEWVDESAALAESDERTRALAVAERNVLDAGGTVLRLSGILAPGRGPHLRLDALAGTARDDGDGWLNLVALPTIVDALTAVLTRDWRGVVNVSSARPLRRRDFYDDLLARTGRESIRWEPAAPDADRGRRIVVQRLREELDVEPIEIDAAWLLS